MKKVNSIYFVGSPWCRSFHGGSELQTLLHLQGTPLQERHSPSTPPLACPPEHVACKSTALAQAPTSYLPPFEQEPVDIGSLGQEAAGSDLLSAKLMMQILLRQPGSLCFPPTQSCSSQGGDFQNLTAGLCQLQLLQEQAFPARLKSQSTGVAEV